MAYRHGFNTSQMFETNHDQNWNHIHSEEPFVHLASSSIIGNNTRFHPGDNLQIDGVQHVSLWHPSARVNEISSMNQSDVSFASGSLRSLVTPNAFQVPDNLVHHTPPSNYIVGNSALDLTVGTNGRRHCKRKSPMIPSINETGSTSGYFCAGSSSNASYGRQNVDIQHGRWEPIAIPPSYNPPVGGESSLRNVRSRSSVEIDPDVFRPHRWTSYPQYLSAPRQPTDHCNPIDHSRRGPTLPLLERNHVHTYAPSHGTTVVAGSGNINQDASHFTIGSSTSNFPGQMGRYSYDLSSSRDPAILQRFHPTSEQIRGARSSYPRRLNPTNREGGLWLGQAAPLEEAHRFIAAESFSNRHPNALTSTGWRNSDRSRSRLFADGFRSFSADAVSHDHMEPEDIIISGRSSFHDSRGLLDQHGEWSLDVDNMSYEELLALGERIGSVSTGLSDVQLLKCLKETYLSSEQVLMEERCVICLEEYQNMDLIGSLKSCNHEYHVGCIKKWLLMKNLCPICKAPALPDDMKKEKNKGVHLNP